MAKVGEFTAQFKEGVQAYADGRPQKANPYEMHSPNWEQWKDGWGMCRCVAYCNMRLKEAEAPPPANKN